MNVPLFLETLEKLSPSYNDKVVPHLMLGDLVDALWSSIIEGESFSKTTCDYLHNIYAQNLIFERIKQQYSPYYYKNNYEEMEAILLKFRIKKDNYGLTIETIDALKKSLIYSVTVKRILEFASKSLDIRHPAPGERLKLPDELISNILSYAEYNLTDDILLSFEQEKKSSDRNSVFSIFGGHAKTDGVPLPDCHYEGEREETTCHSVVAFILKGLSSARDRLVTLFLWQHIIGGGQEANSDIETAYVSAPTK